MCVHLRRAYIVCHTGASLNYVGLEGSHIYGEIEVRIQEWHVIVHSPVEGGFFFKKKRKKKFIAPMGGVKFRFIAPLRDVF